MYRKGNKFNAHTHGTLAMWRRPGTPCVTLTGNKPPLEEPPRERLQWCLQGSQCYSCARPPLVWETPHGVSSGTPELPGEPRSAPAGAHLCRGLLRPGHVVPAEPLAHFSAQRDVALQCRPDR